MAKKAEAWREYREAAMVDMLLDTLPKVRIDFRLTRLPNQPTNTFEFKLSIFPAFAICFILGCC